MAATIAETAKISLKTQKPFVTQKRTRKTKPITNEIKSMYLIFHHTTFFILLDLNSQIIYDAHTVTPNVPTALPIICIIVAIIYGMK